LKRSGFRYNTIIQSGLLQDYIKLHRIKIYFDTPTFTLITKDEKANFEEKISAIGGTMGLLTGFSLLSGIEIIYFGVKIAFKFIKKHMKRIKIVFVSYFNAKKEKVCELNK
jgi:hypothetical protein